MLQNIAKSEHTKICFFCLKVANENVDTHVNVATFLKFLERFTGSRFSQWKSGKKDKLQPESEILVSCKDCKSLLNSFCETYNEFRNLELMLEWRLRVLMSVMKLANRVPARLKQLKRKLHELDCASLDDKVDGNIERQRTETRLQLYKASRLDIINHCSQRLAQSYPKVVITRSDNTYPSKPETISTTLFPKEEDASQISLVENFTKRIVSIAMIATLLPTSTTYAPVNSTSFVNLDSDLDLSSYAEGKTETLSSQDATAKSQVKCEVDDTPEELESQSEGSSGEESIYSSETSSSSEDDEEDKPKVINPQLIKSEDDFSESNSPKKIKNKPGKAAGVTCYKCKKIFATKRGLRKHDWTCHSKKARAAAPIFKSKDKQQYPTWICTVSKCGNHLSSIKDFKAHLKRHGKFTCKFCNIVKEYAPDLAVHEATQHAEKAADETSADIHCSRCPSKFHIKPAFIDHFLETHLKLKPVTVGYCTICGADTIAPHKQKFLKSHFRENHETKGKSPSEIYKCDLCPAYFIKGLQLYLHKIKVHFKEKCPKCRKSYSRLKYLKAHIETCYPDFLPKNFICNIGNCQRPFASKAALSLHQRYTLHDDTGRVFKCSKCKKEFKTKNKLQTHLNSIHAQTTFLCPECGRTFRTKFWLNTHIESHKGVNRDVWKFQCVMCGKKFANPQRLEIHMRMHTQEKPFVCQFCGNSYAHSLGLTRHMKASHQELE